MTELAVARSRCRMQRAGEKLTRLSEEIAAVNGIQEASCADYADVDTHTSTLAHGATQMLSRCPPDNVPPDLLSGHTPEAERRATRHNRSHSRSSLSLPQPAHMVLSASKSSRSRLRPAPPSAYILFAVSSCQNKTAMRVRNHVRLQRRSRRRA